MLENGRQKKFYFLWGFLAMLIVGGLVWYFMPVQPFTFNADEILEIVIFDGNRGEAVHVTEKADIAYLAQNWNGVTLARDGFSWGRMGYRFRVTVYLQNGEEADGWNNFIINSGDVLRKDPFFYRTKGASFDIDYIENLYNPSF